MSRASYFGLTLFSVVLLFSLRSALAQNPSPPTSVIATDYENDDGNAIELKWVPSVDELPSSKVPLTSYHIYRSANEKPWTKLQELPSGTNTFIDQSVSRDSSYQYRVDAVFGEIVAQSIPTQSVTPQRDWFNRGKFWLLIMCIVIGGAVIVLIETARRGRKLFVRKIAGLEAIDNAIGRATEMGRPILFIPGIEDLNEVETLAALTILGRVAKVVADYDTKINMPVTRSLVMTAGRETVKAAYVEAGRPDAYNDDMIRYITDEQFGYVAAVDGIMVRERPATVFLLGAFFGESLILAEMGNQVGAIQIAGTARPPQIPFFVAACDYTLIGEELFAASAYLSGEPKQLGSLKGQDLGKTIAMAAIVVGVLLATSAALNGPQWAESAMDGLTRIFTGD